jgi:hypothetical protein
MFAETTTKYRSGGKHTYFCSGGIGQFAKIHFFLDILCARFYLTLYQAIYLKRIQVNKSIWEIFLLACKRDSPTKIYVRIF